MAKRARPDPAITARWTAELVALATAAREQREATEITETNLKEGIRGAFDEGVLVGAIKDALVEAGLEMSGSRIYQIKFELRDEQLKLVTNGVDLTKVAQ